MRGLQWIICQRMVLYVYQNYPVANCVFFPVGVEHIVYSGSLFNYLVVLSVFIRGLMFLRIHNSI